VVRHERIEPQAIHNAKPQPLIGGQMPALRGKAAYLGFFDFLGGFLIDEIIARQRAGNLVDVRRVDGEILEGLFRADLFDAIHEYCPAVFDAKINLYQGVVTC
jgi:hypothetical protein